MHSTNIDNNDNIVPQHQTNQPIVPRQAHTDAQLIELWLHGRSKHTQRAYRADVRQFLDRADKPLHDVTLGDIQEFADHLEQTQLAAATKHRKLSAVKSLLSFGHRLGYLPFDTGRPLRLPPVRETLSERILSEAEVNKMLALEPNPRNSVILTLLYSSGVRVSELTSLKWRDVQERDDAGQISVFGKGDKTRSILLPNSVWNMIKTLQEDDARDESPVFKSRKGGHLNPSQVWRIVRKAALRAGIEKAVSCHWMRHAHASHALNRGSPISLVQATLSHASISTTGRYLHARPNDSSSRYLGL